MRLIQFLDDNNRTAVARVISATEAEVLRDVASIYELGRSALSQGCSIPDLVNDLGGTRLDYSHLAETGRLLSPLTHPDPAHLLVTGTGLTHLGSADTRDSMHAKKDAPAETDMTDSMKMFRLGVEGGKPAAGEIGAQPEWFYKGDGSIVVAPGEALRSPAFALDAGEEPEIAGCYINDEAGRPWCLGYALGNEFSDHVTERGNYLWLAHSKLRQCAIGPELLVGKLPEQVEGHSRIWRDGKLLWEKPFLSGEAGMSHSLANLTHHHFKYEQFRRPGDAHIHFFGTATLSFADGIKTQPGDVFEIEARDFGRPLRNPIGVMQDYRTQVSELF